LIQDADMEDYGFEYSDDEPEEQDVDIENQYYNSKGYLSIFSLNFSIFFSLIFCSNLYDLAKTGEIPTLCMQILD
jgi:hypothetical protein